MIDPAIAILPLGSLDIGNMDTKSKQMFTFAGGVVVLQLRVIASDFAEM